jgi:type I restriction enzyme S subunit
MALCDQLEAARQQREKGPERLMAATLQRLNQPAADPASFRNDASFALQVLPSLTTTPAQIKQLRQTILNLAVRGKLVEQDPGDEPAAELLGRIAAKKERLLKEGKHRIKHTPTSLSKIDQPYSLPSKWEWVRLGTISADIQYGYTASADSTKMVPKFVRITDIQNSQVDWDSVPGCEIDTDKLLTYRLEENDFLVARTGGTIGKSFLVSSVEHESVFASYLIRIRTFPKFIFPQFLKCYFDSPLYWQQLYAASMGTGQPNVNGKSLGLLNTPVPPLSEQHRIVAKVDELIALCDQLEQQLSQADQQRRRLLEAVLAEALVEPERALNSVRSS